MGLILTADARLLDGWLWFRCDPGLAALSEESSVTIIPPQPAGTAQPPATQPVLSHILNWPEPPKWDPDY